jgi:putative DNA methylase
MRSCPPIDSGFDLSLAEDLARMESFNKHLYRPHTYLHKWWARRCGTTFRLILKHLVQDPACCDYYAPGGLEGQTILDPMMGGGTTLHEAIRLGANVIGMDVDPIPILQARAALSDVSLRRLTEAFDAFHGTVRNRMADLFVTECPVCRDPTEVQFVLYGRRRSCACGAVLFVDSLILRHGRDNSAVTICPRCRRIGRDGRCTCGSDEFPVQVVEKGTVRCAHCGKPYRDDTDVPFYAQYVPLAVVGRCREDGLFFKTASSRDTEKCLRPDAPRPSFAGAEGFHIKPGPKSVELVRRGITSYLDLFSFRQLLYLRYAAAALKDVEPLIRLNLALLVSTSLEFNSMLCGYKGGDRRRPGAIRHTFSHHAYSFPYTALENNPLFPAKTSGTLQSLFHSRIVRGRLWAKAPRERAVRSSGVVETVLVAGEVNIGVEASSSSDLTSGTRRFLLMQGSSASMTLQSDSVDHVVTDPPYFDSVQYTDLAAFFRAWLRVLVPGAAHWDYNEAEAAVETHGCKDNDRYIRMLTSIFSESRRVLKKDYGRLIFTFHHGNPRGWSALTIALKRAGFVLVNRYIVLSENPSSVHIMNLKAIRHDAILITAPEESGLRPHWKLPGRLDAADSRTFCESCATTLGWMLGSGLSEEDMAVKWDSLMTATRSPAVRGSCAMRAESKKTVRRKSTVKT